MWRDMLLALFCKGYAKRQSQVMLLPYIIISGNNITFVVNPLFSCPQQNKLRLLILNIYVITYRDENACLIKSLKYKENTEKCIYCLKSGKSLNILMPVLIKNKIIKQSLTFLFTKLLLFIITLTYIQRW